ncbi:MAG: hypothetical protein J7494_02535 [Sphingobium sp.]|nr:hypothetical protein [Sphingobium sp.]
MNRDEHGQPQGNASRGTSRIVEAIPDKGRRSFLQIALAHGIAAPVALASFGSAKAAMAAESQPANPQSGRAGNVDAGGPNASAKNRAGIIIRDFADPYLELLRLLREAAEIEHGLMLQYLYCAFSIKARYQPLVGFGAPTSTNLLGVAVQEMQHLGAVNRLLVALGSRPHLDRQDFPYEPDIYPFPFMLEPASRRSVAKYVYTEGPASIFAANGQRSREDEQFSSRVLSDIGGLDRPNHVGSLYRNVLGLLSECTGRPGFPLTPAEVEKWQSDLTAIMDEGEHEHFEFFRQVYEGRHPAFAKSGVKNVWDLEPGHEAYPAHPLPENPSAFVGHPNQIVAENAHGIAWLSNLHYWLVLCCLDFSYRYADQNVRGLSTSQMMTALLPLATELPKRGAGVPFDALSMGYALGTDKEHSRRIILALAGEARAFAKTIEAQLPSQYSQNSMDAVFEVLGG